MEIIGVTKTRPSFGCDLAVRKGYPLYCTYDAEEKIAAFGPAGYDCKGGLTDLLSVADIVVDCSPGKVGAQNKELYQNGIRVSVVPPHSREDQYLREQKQRCNRIARRR